MRLVLGAALVFAAVPALAQSTDKAPARKAPSGSGSAALTGTDDCMSLWKPDTHMTKAEWAQTCQRMQGRLDEIRRIETNAPRSQTNSKQQQP